MAATKRDQIKCGNCGGAEFTIFHEGPLDATRVGGMGNGEIEGHLVLKCQECSEETRVEPFPARMRAVGNACGGWHD